MPKLLPTNISDFRKIREGDYLYIDKTEYLYELVRHPGGAWFLSRPRRFGKSLWISMLDELFHSNRALFQDLWIDSSDYNWESHPVFRLDFNLYPSKSAAELEQNIKKHLATVAALHKVTLNDGPYYVQFADLIYALSAERQLVVLIDEYDKPLIDNLHNAAEAKAIRDVLKGFYGILKSLDSRLRMVFITGISKFSRVGVFSDLNNLTDITMHYAFATAFGLTEAEIRTNFAEHIVLLTQKQGITEDGLLAKMRYWYNGFCFSPATENVYNPYSTLLFFYNQRFANYWFESGTPTFLVNLLRQRNYEITELDQLRLGELAFSTYEIDNLAIVPLLFQTGYLTIKGYDPRTQQYDLGYPNYEVENAFLVYLLDAFSESRQGFSEAHLWQMVEALEKQDLNTFFTVLQALFANIDYDLHLGYEKYYQTIFYLVFKLIGLRINAEVKTNAGRIDAVIETAELIFLFEFKVDSDAHSALKQIQDNQYYQKYLRRGKPITCVGANFDTAARNIDDWITQVVDQG
ncbi:MAG: AAA family ATPase [Caldilineaceae bacterium]